MINQYFLTRKIFSGNNFEILILSFYLAVKCWGRSLRVTSLYTLSSHSS